MLGSIYYYQYQISGLIFISTANCIINSIINNLAIYKNKDLEKDDIKISVAGYNAIFGTNITSSTDADFADENHPLYGYERLKAFRGAQVSGTGQDLSIDVFVQDATEIIAGTPYLITYPSNHSDIVNPLFENITVTATEPSNVSANGVTFQGMFAPVHITSYEENTTQDYLFLGANNQLAWPTNDATSMRGFRAYFIIDRQVITPSMAPRNSRARIVEHTDTTTDMETVTGHPSPVTQKLIENGQLIIIKNGVRYNAQGQIVK